MSAAAVEQFERLYAQHRDAHPNTINHDVLVASALMCGQVMPLTFWNRYSDILNADVLNGVPLTPSTLRLHCVSAARLVADAFEAASD